MPLYSYMLPCLFVNDIVNCIVSESQFRSDVHLPASGLEKRFNPFDYLRIKHSYRTQFSSFKSSFICSVLHVLTVGSKEKVTWVNAVSFVSARAVVANFKAIWNWTNENLVCRVVRELRFVTSAAVKVSVPFFVESFIPYPAIVRIGNINGTPKSGNLVLLALSATKPYVGFDFPTALEVFAACSTIKCHLKLFLLGVRGQRLASLAPFNLGQLSINVQP